MRLSLIAVAMCSGWIAGTRIGGGAPILRYKGDRIERSHANWTGKRQYSAANIRSAGTQVIRSSHRQYARWYNAVTHIVPEHAATMHMRQRPAPVRAAPPLRSPHVRVGRPLSRGPSAALGAVGGCGRSSAAVRNIILPPTGGVTDDPADRRSAPWSSGRITSASITGRASNGQWIVKSGNDGNRVRERARSVAGAVFRVG